MGTYSSSNQTHTTNPKYQKCRVHCNIFHAADANGEDIWICELGDTDEEGGLVVYEILRVTRKHPDGHEACLCIDCAEKILHGGVLSC